MSLAQRVLCAALLWAAAAVTAFGAVSPSESDLKAAFIYHFTQFVEWPDTAFQGEGSPFVIGVLGADPFGGTLEALVRGESVGSHPIKVRLVKDADSQASCHILFVTRDGESRLDSRRVGASPVLTVGESEQFFEAGGMVEFVTEHRHVRIKIDLGEARSHRLTISAKLLRVAEVVGDDGGGSFDVAGSGDFLELGPVGGAPRPARTPGRVPALAGFSLTAPSDSR